VAIVGPGGAGKTTFATELGRRTGLPVVHLDRLHWQPGWVETPTTEWEEIVTREVSEERWIMDGNYAGTYGTRFSRADTIIVLAPPRWRCLRGALGRILSNRGRAVQADGCPERVDLHYLRWIYRYPTASRPGLDRAIAGSGRHARVVELRSPIAVEAFLASVRG